MSSSVGLTEAEEAKLSSGRCVLPCRHDLCAIFGTREEVFDGVLRADGREAFCMGCTVERTEPCMRLKCGFQCSTCTPGIVSRRASAAQLIAASTPGVCGQKHSFSGAVVRELGGLSTRDCDIPAIEPKRLPDETFIPVLENDRGWMREIVGEHRAWATTLKMIYPEWGKRSPRAIMGVPDDHLFTMNFHVKDLLLEDLWRDPRREEFWSFCKDHFDFVSSVNYSVFISAPRFTGFINMKRSIITYAEMTRLGIPVLLEWPDQLPSFMDHYMLQFAHRNGIWGISMNMQTYKGVARELYAQLKRLDAALDPEVVFVSYGLTTPADAFKIRAMLKRRKVYFGNANVYTRSVYFDLVPGQKASRKKYSQGEVFAENVRRWERWLTERTRSR